MRAFIERVFMSRKKKQEELLNEKTTTNTTEQATEANIKTIEPEVKHDINSCGCYKCEIARDQDAK